MKRVVVAVVVVIAAGVAGWFAWQRFAGGTQPSLAQQFPTVASACPDDANDLAGIEGWAPGAGKAEKMGQGGAGSFGGFGAALGGASQTPSAEATGCRTLAPEAVAYFHDVAQLRDAIPDAADPQAVGASLADAGAIFAYVRDRIHTEAYPGTMRGQLGALASGGGSSADKALVLGGLLATKNVPTRYVHASLGTADAAAVVDAALAPVAASGSADQALAQRLAEQFSVDLPTARTQYDAARTAILRQTADAVNAARDQVGSIAQQLASAGHPLAASDSQRAVLLADVRDHWWVQAQVGGTWIDLDPTLPTSKQGTHLGPAPSDQPLTDLPASLDTTVTVRIVARTIDATGVHDATAVEGTASSASLYAQPIEIGLGDRSTGAFDPSKIAAFEPSIAIGGTNQTGDPIVPDPAVGARLAQLRLQIVTTVPGSAPVTATRLLVDRRSADGKSIDPAWTPAATAYAMTQHRSLLAMTGDFSDAFALKADLTNTLRYGAAAAYALAGGDGAQKAPPDMASAFPVEAMRFFQRDAAVRRGLESATDGLRFLYTAPVIVGISRGFALANGKPAVIERFDIVENAMTASGSPSAANANAIRGYEDTAIEQKLLGVPTDGGTPALMAAAASSGIPTAVRTDPAYGGVAIVPQRAVAMDGHDRMGWWQVDPASGNLIGRMDDGSGQALGEYVTQMNDTMSMYSAISFYADMLRCQVFGMTSPLRGEGGPDAAMAYLDCMKSAACSFLTGFAAGELYAREDADLQALAYNILDLSFDTHLGVSKGSWAPPGVWCSKYAPSP